MADGLRTEELAQLLRTKRRGMTIRAAAERAGVSPATLWRAEKGESVKDVDVIAKLMAWLGVPPQRVMTSVRTVKVHEGDSIAHGARESTPEMIEAHLRADKDLDPATAEALGNAFRTLYDAYAKKHRRDTK